MEQRLGRAGWRDGKACGVSSEHRIINKLTDLHSKLSVSGTGLRTEEVLSRSKTVCEFVAI